MSIKTHPNINAAGLIADIIESILKHSRGNTVGSDVLTPAIKDLAITFAVVVSTELDNQFGTKPKL